MYIKSMWQQQMDTEKKARKQARIDKALLWFAFIGFIVMVGLFLI